MFKTAALAGASWLALLGAAAAQEAPGADARDARIQALENQLAEIQAQLNDLKEASTADVQEVRRVASEQPVVSLANGRPTISAPDNSFRFAVRAMAQLDAVSYLQDDPQTPDNRRADTNAASDLNSGANFRRARIGIEGAAFKDWNYALTYELGGTGTIAAASRTSNSLASTFSVVGRRRSSGTSLMAACLIRSRATRDPFQRPVN